MLNLNIIGCGRAGGTVASALAATGQVRIGQVLNRSQASAARAVGLLGAGEATDHLTALQPSDLWLIGTSDDQIRASAGQLAGQGALVEGAVVFHLSGRFGPDVLDQLARSGAETASVHPVRSMPRLSVDHDDFRGTLCVAEGSEAALAALREPFLATGAGWHEVHGLNRGLYHAALSIVSNVTKGVVWKAQNWLEQAGLDAEAAAKASNSLLSITAGDVSREGAQHSITGPVVRGDTSTVEAHLEALARTGQHDVDIYRVLARTVLDLANERGDLSNEVMKRFDELFDLKQP